MKIIKGSGTYTYKDTSNPYGIFVPNKNGRIGWAYDTPIDISEYKYLVINLRSLTTATPNFGVIICPKQNNVWHASELARNKVTVIDLQSARYTTAVSKNKPLDLTRIASISLTSDGTTADAKIYVSEVYLTNENPVGIDEVEVTPNTDKVNVYTLAGQLLQKGTSRSEAVKSLPAGIYVIGNKKVIIR